MNQPNIIYILSDDLGWSDLSVEGSTFYESPNIDRIANEGMRFTQGYATCQVCSPSRASILTGKFPPRHGITATINAKTGESWRELNRFNQLLPAENERGLRANEITLAEALRRSGYRTFFAGKWHLGYDEVSPEKHGFEINKGGWSIGSPKGGYFAPFGNPKLEDGPDGESLPIRLGTETARFIEENQDEPFFAFLSFYSVHGPIQTTLEKWDKYRRKALAQGDKPKRRFIFDRYLPTRQVQDCPIYGGMIEAMDEAVGLVLDTLKRLGLEENTIVVFTSDNGGASSGDAFATSCLPLRGGKGRQWEGGIRVPFHIKAPGVTTAGSLCDVPVSGIDYYSTLLELAGLTVPPEQDVDGLSLVPLLQGQEDRSVSERDLYWHFPHYSNLGGEPSCIIRNREWKLIHYFEDGRDELYNLESDPGEQTDLLAEQPAKAKELRGRLDAWMIEVDAKLPRRDPEYDAEKEKNRLRMLETERMAQLESQHAEYLDPDWKPNEDWWGSQVTTD